MERWGDLTQLAALITGITAVSSLPGTLLIMPFMIGLYIFFYPVWRGIYRKRHPAQLDEDEPGLGLKSLMERLEAQRTGGEGDDNSSFSLLVPACEGVILDVLDEQEEILEADLEAMVVARMGDGVDEEAFGIAMDNLFHNGEIDIDGGKVRRRRSTLPSPPAA